MADALAQGCDTLVTTGGVQSNHARQTAAAAAQLGLHCELLLPRLVAGRSASYERSGNVLLDRLLGARVQILPREDYQQQTFDDALAAADPGRKPYFIPIGGSTPLGALGYVVAVQELLAQMRDESVEPTAIVVGTGSGGTHAGVVAGMVLAGHAARVQGISVSGVQAERETLVARLATEALALLGTSGPQVAEDVMRRTSVLDQYVGPGYGQPTEAMIEAVQLVARLEGILLDPVYTGKAMAGLLDLVRGAVTKRNTVIFWHTGGVAGLFGYDELFPGQ